MTDVRRLAHDGLSRLVPLGRAHWVFLILLTAGAVLRAVAFLAYRPALLYHDSIPYLANAAALEPYPVRPAGYPAFLRMLPLEHQLAVVPFVQHLFGLLIAVVLYMLLGRLGVRRWLAALAVAPVLLDGYQLNIEQQILSETLFDLLVVGAIAVLLWRRPLSMVAAGGAGLLLAAAALTRASALFIIVPAVLALLLLRARPTRVAVLLALFVLPIGGYALWFHSYHSAYSITGYGGRFLYARVAPFADCTKFSVPAQERVLCPKQPVGQRPTIEQFMWDKKLSPVYRLDLEAGQTKSTVAGKLAKRVIRHQPFEYGKRVAHDFVHAFAPTHSRRRGDLPVSRWQFQRTYPIYRSDTNAVIRAYGGKRAQVRPRLARFLHDYQRYVYTPGPLLALALILAVLAALGVGRARRSGLQTSSFLFASISILVLLTAVAVNQFTWRYQLPLLVLVGAAGALGVTALMGDASGKPGDGSAAADPPRRLRSLRQLFSSRRLM